MVTPTISQRSNVAQTHGLLFRGAALIAAFWFLAADYLFVYFSGDDFMNLFQALDKRWALVRGVILFWSSQTSRPVAGVLYVGLYSLFGLHSFPFHLVMLLILTVNLLIAWRIAALLLDDACLGAVAPLLVFYYASGKGDTYYNFGNFGTIYDIICFTFMYSALWIWLRFRQTQRFPGGPAVALIAVLQILALGSKEMAVAFPAIIFLRELFYGGLVDWTKRRVEWRAVSAIGVFTLITVVYLAGKSLGPDSLLNNSLYRPTFSAHIYFQRMSAYLNQLFYTNNFFHGGRTTLFMVGGLVIALLLRARVMAFGWLWYFVSILPVAFIPMRGRSVLYIPALGLTIAAADLLRRLFHAGVGKIRGLRAAYLDPAGAPVFVLGLVCLTPLYWHLKQDRDEEPKLLSRQYESFAEDLRRAGDFHRGSSLLYLRDPFDEERYDAQFISSLLRREHDLRVSRAAWNQALLSPVVMTKYDEIYDFVNGHLQRIANGDVVAVSNRLRAEFGSVDLLSGLYLTADGWWWTKKDFSVAVGCPAAQVRCEFTVDLSAPADPDGTGGQDVSIDVGGAHWRDVRLPIGFQPTKIEIPSQPGKRFLELQFHVRHAIRLPEPTQDRRELAIILSAVHIH